MRKNDLKKDEIIETLNKNFIYLIIEFYEMQTEFMSVINKELKDIDKGYIIFFIMSKLFEKIDVKEKDFQSFSTENYKLSINNFKIIDLVNGLSIPKETVRRKIDELINNNLLKYNNKNMTINFNQKSIINIFKNNIQTSSKFISKFSVFYSRVRMFGSEFTQKEVEKKIIDNFELNFQLFVTFQLNYYKIWKDTIKDFNLVLIFLLCALNNFYLIRKNYPEKSKIDLKKTFTTIHKLNYQRGLNATSISELSSIPRATVIRKMKWFFDHKLITKDKNNLYSIKLNNDYSNNYVWGKMPSVIEEISNYLSNSYKNY